MMILIADVELKQDSFQKTVAAIYYLIQTLYQMM